MLVVLQIATIIAEGNPKMIFPNHMQHLIPV